VASKITILTNSFASKQNGLSKHRLLAPPNEPLILRSFSHTVEQNYNKMMNYNP
jgi:hypothetical protein